MQILEQQHHLRKIASLLQELQQELSQQRANERTVETLEGA